MVWQAMWTTFPTFCMTKMLFFLCHIILSENKELMVDVYYMYIINDATTIKAATPPPSIWVMIESSWDGILSDGRQ